VPRVINLFLTETIMDEGSAADEIKKVKKSVKTSVAIAQESNNAISPASKNDKKNNQPKLATHRKTRY